MTNNRQTALELHITKNAKENMQRTSWLKYKNVGIKCDYRLKKKTKPGMIKSG